MDKSELIWMNGELVPWDNANVHVLSHGLHYGTGVFEGIRAYETDGGTAVFRHREHLERLARSAQLYYMELPYSVDELRDATRELIRRNGLASCYIRPIAFRGYGEMGLFAQSAPIDVVVAVWPWGAYLGEEGKRSGIRCKVSSWRGISGDSLIPHAKASGQYLNSILAKTESRQRGLRRGDPARRPGQCLRGLRRERLHRPRRRALDAGPHQLDPRRHHPPVRDPDRERPGLPGRVERDIARAELFLADEVFLTGTAAELVPVREVDDHQIGEPGEVTRVIQAKFEDALHGRAPEYLEWLDVVEQPSKVTS